MKKTLALFMVLSILICCTNCGEKDKPSEGKTSTADSLAPGESAVSVTEDNSEQSESEWGVQEEIVSGKNDILATAYIRFPTLSGIVRGTGKIAYQTDDTLVLLDAERKTGSPELDRDSCDGVFPAYFEQTKKIMKSYRQMNYEDFDFTVETKEVVTINGYEMCKYTGKHTFTVDGEAAQLNYVAYATKLKENDAIVYWMVLDESVDQSLGNTIEEYAQKMAYSLCE